MKLEEINIRDPFVLREGELYYLYGTRAVTCWGEADGFDCYLSRDLKEWEGPYEIFHRPEGFWADKNYWAPEVHPYRGAWYLFATFNSVAENKKGTMILRAESPRGPFQLHSHGKITPPAWNCLDGTFYVSKAGIPYMIFSHEWEDCYEPVTTDRQPPQLRAEDRRMQQRTQEQQTAEQMGTKQSGIEPLTAEPLVTGIRDGEICLVQLKEDLTEPEGEVRRLFAASQGGSWVRAIAHPRFPGQRICVTDGPFVHRAKDGSLYLLWSSFGEQGYVEAVSRSDNGEIDGHWIQQETPLYEENGGHGMIFETAEGGRYLTLHYPNVHLQEHPVFYPVVETPEGLVRKEGV